MKLRAKPFSPFVVLVVLALFAGACSSDPPETSEPEGTTTTTERAAAANPDFSIDLSSVDTNVLVGELNITAAVPVTAEVQIREAGDDEIVRQLDGWTPDTDLRLPVVGMVESSDFEITVQLLTETNELYGAPEQFDFTTGALPDDLPKMSTKMDPDKKAPGDTLFNLIDLQGAAELKNLDPDRDLGHLMIVDEAGEIIWYYRNPLQVGDAKQLPNGNVLADLGDVLTVELNMFGEVITEWAGRYARADVEGLLASSTLEAVASPDAIAVDVDAFHHEHSVLPSGNHLALSSELKTIDGFEEPRCGENAASFNGSYDLAGDRIVEFDAETGEIVKDFSLFDYFDPLVDFPEEDVCNPAEFVFPNIIYGPNVAPDIRDWTHANAVVLDEERNALIVSVRHQDAVLAIRYEDDDQGKSGELLWRLGPNGTLDMDPADYSYHQHAPEVQSDGTILVYDNGNLRPGAEEPFSRTVLYDIDDAAGTAEVIWEYLSEIDGAPAFAGFVGDADRLSNGNVMIVDGGLLYGVNGVFAQINEVVPDGSEGGEVAFNLRVETVGFGIYRAERLETLVPSGAGGSPIL